jgi:tetraacyldisaccharide-1-P 4'-kinase
MKLSTPRWWYRRERTAPVARLLLTPLSWIWAAATPGASPGASRSIPACR